MRKQTFWDGPQHKAEITLEYENCKCPKCNNIFEIILTVVKNSSKAFADCPICRTHLERNEILKGIEI